MRYEKVLAGTFLSRPNRFIALVDLEGRRETVHVKNTGRCRELLVPGARVYLSRQDAPGRKTKYDLIAVEKGGLLINMDSQAPNAVAGELLPRLFPGARLFPERPYGSSRFDYYLETGSLRGFVEVKGVTLERDGLALFPDAPTIRGTRHLQELQRAREEGYAAYILFLIQMRGPRAFTPNDATDPAFGRALRQAAGAGVGVLCRDCLVTPDTIVPGDPVPVFLDVP